MFPDSAEETLTLTMGDLQLMLPRTTQPAPSSPPLIQQLFSHKYPSTFSEQVDFPDARFDFYSSSFDNSFPNRGNLNHERSISCSSPTSNTSFLSETSFSSNNQSYLRNLNDSGNASDSFGLLTTTSTSYRGNDEFNLSSDFQHLSNRRGGASFNNGELPQEESFLPTSQANQAFNDSALASANFGSINRVETDSGSGHWDSPTKPIASTPKHSKFEFAFPSSESAITGITSSDGSVSSSSNGSNASADSPSRLVAATSAAPGTAPSENQWNSSNVSSLMDNQCPESSSSNSAITTSVWGPSIWSQSSQVSAANSNSANGNGYVNSNACNKYSSNSQQLDESLLIGLTKHQLLEFVALLKREREKYVQNGDSAREIQIQGVLVQVQNYIIATFVSDASGSVSSVTSPTTTITSPLLPSPTETVERASNFHRDAESKEATYTWRGHLPPRIHRNPTYSCKVFLGGLPWDITEYTLMQAFEPFGIVKIEWPGKEGVSTKPKGYAYAVFESEKQVKQLLLSCTQDYNYSRSGNYFYKISSKKFRGKDVQIIPWALSDSNFNRCEASKIDPGRTIFVGALHGMVNAEGLATIMNDLFGGVVYAGIDTDRTRYPIGSARVTFSNETSYMKAVTAAFVYIKTSRFEKKLQVDPYLEDATCSVCNLQQGPYFCRNKECFRYFCRTCFHYKHSESPFLSHTPMMRTTHNKPQQMHHGNHANNYNGNNNSGPFFNNSNMNNGHRNQSYPYGSPNNHHHQPYSFGAANSNQHHNNYNNAHHGFTNGGGNYRQWSNGNNGRHSPLINYPGGGGPGIIKPRNKFF